MRRTSRIEAVAGMICMSLWTAASYAAALVDQVQLLGDASVTAVPIPAARTFTVSKAGSYALTLKDLDLPATCESLSIALVSSTGSVEQLASAGTSSSFQLQAGTTYTVQALASASSGSFCTYSAWVAPTSGGANVWQDQQAVAASSPPPPAGQTILSTTFSVANPGSYSLTLTDLAFPAALVSGSIDLYVANDADKSTVGTPVAGANPGTFPLGNLSAGTYDLIVVAQASGSAPDGLYTVSVTGGSPSATVLAITEPVGTLTAEARMAIPSAQSVALHVTDLAAPSTLGSLGAVVTQGASELMLSGSGGSVSQISAPGTYSFSAAASAPMASADPLAKGDVQVFVVAQPGSEGESAYALYALGSTSGTLADAAVPVVDSDHYGFAFGATLGSGGTYQVSPYDFARPQAFASRGGSDTAPPLSALAVQHGALLADQVGAGSSPGFTAAAGPLALVAFATTPAAGDDGLFDLQLSTQSSGDIVYDTTQGVGAEFRSTTVNVSSAGPYDAQITDMDFPAGFGELALIATQGTTEVGEIVGGGKFSFQATPGTYVMNLLAQPSATAHYGLYGMNVSPPPPVPTVTLSAMPNTVAAGGQATLTWSATNATSCTASGGPSGGSWSGTLPVSGNQSTGALDASTTFSISCTGDGGTKSASVKVSVSAGGGGGGGGGALSIAALLILAAALLGRKRYGRRDSAGERTT
jgi:hypothetical protein